MAAEAGGADDSPGSPAGGAPSSAAPRGPGEAAAFGRGSPARRAGGSPTVPSNSTMLSRSMPTRAASAANKGSVPMGPLVGPEGAWASAADYLVRIGESESLD